jgi:hypothetical protein
VAAALVLRALDGAQFPLSPSLPLFRWLYLPRSLARSLATLPLSVSLSLSPARVEHESDMMSLDMTPMTRRPCRASAVGRHSKGQHETQEPPWGRGPPVAWNAFRTGQAVWNFASNFVGDSVGLGTVSPSLPHAIRSGLRAAALIYLSGSTTAHCVVESGRISCPSEDRQHKQMVFQYHEVV